MTKDGHQVILTAHLDKLAGNTNEGSKQITPRTFDEINIFVVYYYPEVKICTNKDPIVSKSPTSEV
jgi:hypothetical protein